MYRFKKSLWGMILLVAVVLCLCPPASAQGNLDFSLFSSPLLDPDPIPFALAVNYAVEMWPMSVFCADLDGDLDLDLAVANYMSDNVSILRNLSRYFLCGDVNVDGVVNVVDVVYFINYLFKNGPGLCQPQP